MDLHGLISEPSPRSAGGDGKSPAPGPEGGARAFGEVVASNRPQHTAQDGTDAARAGSGNQPDLKPGQLPAHLFDMADSPANGLSTGAYPTLPAPEIVATAPVAASPDAGSNKPPGASGDSISDHDDAFDLPEARVPVAALANAGAPALPGTEPRTASRANSFAPPTPAAGGPPPLTGSSARAAPGVATAPTPAAPGAPSSPLPPGPISLAENADAANLPPRAAGEATAPDPGTSTAQSARANATVPVSPLAAGAAAGEEPATARSAEHSATSRRMPGMAQAPASDRARAAGATSPEPPPRMGPKPADDAPGRLRAGGRAAQPAPAALPVWASSPPPGGPPDGPGPMPILRELPSAALSGRGPVVRDAVMQALGDSGGPGLAAPSAASAQSPAGPAQAPVAAPQANAGGAETARAVAPQIAAAISSVPGSGRIELRLDPPELGRVEILLEFTDQSLRATLAAERPATNELLRRHGEILLAQLQQAGFTGIDLQFAGNRAGNQAGAQPGEAPRPASAGDPEAPPDSDNADPPASRVAWRTTDGLDLRL